MWILAIVKDGHIRYCGEPFQDSKGRMVIMGVGKYGLPYAYKTREDAERTFRDWQKSFPADAEGWEAWITWYGR